MEASFVAYSFYLRGISKRWPQISFTSRIIDKDNKELWASTLVRIKRDDKWWLVHCCEMIVIRDDIFIIGGISTLINRLNISSFKTKLHYELTGHEIFEWLDDSQLEEEEMWPPGPPSPEPDDVVLGLDFSKSI